MAKAMLIMDMPSSCSECDFCEHEDEGWLYCTRCDKTALAFEKPTWCPLREVPQKPDYPPINENSYVAGYNACIDEILGGTE